MGVSTFLNGGTATQLRGLRGSPSPTDGFFQARTIVDDGGGGGTAVWTYGAARLPCRIDPLADSGASSVTGGRIDERSTHLVTTPAGAAVGC